MVSFHAVIGKNVSSLFDVLFALRHFRENDWHFRHRLCRFFDLLFRQGHRNRPHLLSGGVILMRPTLSFSKFPELLLDIRTGKPGDGWNLEFLVPFPILSVAGDANLLLAPPWAHRSNRQRLLQWLLLLPVPSLRSFSHHRRQALFLHIPLSSAMTASSASQLVGRT